MTTALVLWDSSKQLWTVVDDAGKTVDEFAVEAEANARAQAINKKIYGQPTSVTVRADDYKRGCTCGRGVMLPGEELCKVHYSD